MSEINRINNDLYVDDMVYRQVSTLPNQNIEGHLCIKYNGKELEFKDKDCANYVYNLRKLLKECLELLYKLGFVFARVEDAEKAYDVREQIYKFLGEE